MKFKKWLLVIPAVCLMTAFGVYKFNNRTIPSADSQERAIASEEGGTVDASPYKFGGACSSQGSWTAAALAQTSSIKNVLTAIKDDPNCKGMETLVNQMQTIESSFTTKSPDGQENNVATWEGLPKDMQALRELGRTSGSKTKDVMNLLMGKTLNNAVLSRYKDIAIRSDRVARTGLKFIDQTLTVLPQFDRCLMDKPNQTVALVGGLLKLTSAFASSGENVIGDAGNTIAKLATYMRESKYSTQLAKLDQTELWMSMSCMIETTTENYCSVRDTYQMLDLAANSKAINMNKMESNPLEGYFLLTREIPIISAWLQKVQFGAMPRLISDTIPKNTTIMSYANFQSKQNILLAKFAQDSQVIAEETDINKKKIAIKDMIMSLAETIVNFDDTNGAVNFYTKARNDDLIPFFLIGRSAIPPECLGRMAITASEYLRGDGVPNQPEFADPSSLVLRIGEQLKVLNDEAALIAGRYYQLRVIVDNPNLFNESTTSQTVTVYESMQRISNYLNRLIANSVKQKRNLLHIPSMIETKKRIDGVLASYSKVRSKILEYIEAKKEIMSKEDFSADELEDFQVMVHNDQEIKESAPKIIQQAFENFNVAVQKDTFLATRLATFVQKDFAMKIQNSTSLTKDQQDLLIASGSSLIDRLNISYQKDPNSVRLDLDNAQVVNMRNIDSLEAIFADPFAEAIEEVKAVAENGMAKPTRKLNPSSSAVKNYLRSAADYVYYDMLFKPMKSVESMMNSMTHRLKFGRKGTIMSQESAQGSFKGFQAKLCIQALAFSNQSKFKKLCKNAVLGPVIRVGELIEDEERINSGLTPEEIEKRKARVARENRILTDDLTVKYISHAEAAEGGSRVKLSQYGKNAQRDMNICAFRNYRRANYAYWMVKEFSGTRSNLKND